jgi:anti-sigma factor RsiW
MLRAVVRCHAAIPPVPAHVQRRIVQHAMHPARRFDWRAYLQAPVRLWDIVISMGGVAVFVVLMFGSFSTLLSGDDMMQKVVREASMAYGTYTGERMPMEVVSADDTTVTQWFNAHMGYQMPVPCITDSASQLLGGRLCRLLDRKSAALMYQRHGVNILLFAFKGDHLSLPTRRVVQTKAGTFYVQNVAGRPVAVWQHHGITYSIVGNLDRDALLQVAATVRYR